MNPILGIVFHAIGGFAAGSFYTPCKKIKGWSWETYWLVLGVFAWIVTPLVMAMIFTPGYADILSSTPMKVIFWSYFFGVLWGIGGLTFGLTMRYLGISLGVSLALGLCAMFGTLIPPIYEQFFGDGSAMPNIVQSGSFSLPSTTSLSGYQESSHFSGNFLSWSYNPPLPHNHNMSAPLLLRSQDVGATMA